MSIGSWVSRAIGVAGELRVADRLAAGPRVAERLAACPGLRQRTRHAIPHTVNNLCLGSRRNCAQDETDNAQDSDQDREDRHQEAIRQLTLKIEDPIIVELCPESHQRR